MDASPYSAQPGAPHATAHCDATYLVPSKRHTHSCRFLVTHRRPNASSSGEWACRGTLGLSPLGSGRGGSIQRYAEVVQGASTADWTRHTARAARLLQGASSVATLAAREPRPC